MPEMTVTVRWPDGRIEDCYSPSLVMWDHLRPGETYTVNDFSRRATYALCLAGERVREKYGFGCSSAADTTARIQATAASFDADQMVEVLQMEPSL